MPGALRGVLHLWFNGYMMSEAEKDALVAEILNDIRAKETAEKAAETAAQEAANADHAARINAALPVQVRVGAHPSDSSWETGTCDRDRIGWVRTPAGQNDHGYWHAYIEDMSPGDDDSPSRYHQPRHLHILQATRKEDR